MSQDRLHTQFLNLSKPTEESASENVISQDRSHTQLVALKQLIKKFDENKVLLIDSKEFSLTLKGLNDSYLPVLRDLLFHKDKTSILSIYISDQQKDLWNLWDGRHRFITILAISGSLEAEKIWNESIELKDNLPYFNAESGEFEVLNKIFDSPPNPLYYNFKDAMQGTIQLPPLDKFKATDQIRIRKNFEALQHWQNLQIPVDFIETSDGKPIPDVIVEKLKLQSFVRTPKPIEALIPIFINGWWSLNKTLLDEDIKSFNIPAFRRGFSFNKFNILRGAVRIEYKRRYEKDTIRPIYEKIITNPKPIITLVQNSLQYTQFENFLNIISEAILKRYQTLGSDETSMIKSAIQNLLRYIESERILMLYFIYLKFPNLAPEILLEFLVLVILDPKNSSLFTGFSQEMIFLDRYSKLIYRKFCGNLKERAGLSILYTFTHLNAHSIPLGRKNLYHYYLNTKENITTFSDFENGVWILTDNPILKSKLGSFSNDTLLLLKEWDVDDPKYLFETCHNWQYNRAEKMTERIWRFYFCRK